MHPRLSALAALRLTDPDEKVAATRAISLPGATDSIATDPIRTAGDDLGVPGRPDKPLRVAATAVQKRSPFTTEGRAALIHSICHIEFNAINLALDAVWRYDGMPEAYYRDWLRVADEEALHFTLLHTHLQDMGWRYGDFPGHDGLWNMCEKTKDDVLARMALVPRTLEARGLDATPLIGQAQAREHARCAARSGDPRHHPARRSGPRGHRQPLVPLAVRRRWPRRGGNLPRSGGALRRTAPQTALQPRSTQPGGLQPRRTARADRLPPRMTNVISDQTWSRPDLLACLKDRKGAEPLHFERCNFDEADLSRLDLRGAQFTLCNFAETSFDRTLLSETRWAGCRARQADFGLADLTNARFQDCDLNNTQWTRAKLASAFFSGVKLTGAHFGEVSALGIGFKDSLLVDAHLRGMSFRKQKLEQLDFSEADLSGCDFRETVFEGGSLRNAHLKLARFEGADLREVDLGGLRLANAAQFKGATISHRQAASLVEELGLRVV
jgi:uncharacterized ferritin-like protein (DUF455 family)/uncharacterized protein YjbI with pentapeptide repeats